MRNDITIESFEVKGDIIAIEYYKGQKNSMPISIKREKFEDWLKEDDRLFVQKYHETNDSIIDKEFTIEEYWVEWQSIKADLYDYMLIHHANDDFSELFDSIQNVCNG